MIQTIRNMTVYNVIHNGCVYRELNTEFSVLTTMPPRSLYYSSALDPTESVAIKLSEDHVDYLNIPTYVLLKFLPQ